MMKNLLVETFYLNKIPIVLCYQQAEHRLPLVLIAHGFNGCKFDGTPLAIQLASLGIAALTFDLSKQGERADDTFDTLTSDAEFGLALFSIIQDSYKDMCDLIEFVKKDSRFDFNRLGMYGVSLGAMLTYYTLSQSQEVDVAVTSIGSPDFLASLLHSMEKESMDDLSEQEQMVASFVQSLNPKSFLLLHERRPLLINIASKDDDIPPQDSIDFYHQLKKNYQSNPDLLKLNLEDEFHFESKNMIREAVEWFAMHLGSNKTIEN